MPEKLFQIERKPEEHHDILHIRMPVPRRRSILPTATRGHLRAALRETLLAQRSVLDALIKKTEPSQTPQAPRRQAE